jgi:tetratricopeptide (TPR) repeat protein
VSLRAVEKALIETIRTFRIVDIVVPSGGEIQICLLVDRQVASREAQILSRKAELARLQGDWRAHLQLAELYYHSGRWDEATEQYRFVLALNPRCFAASLRLSTILLEQQKPSDAAAACRTALMYGHSAAQRATLEAMQLSAEGRYADAAPFFRRAIELAPRRRENYVGLHYCLARRGRYDEQLENLSAMRKSLPSDLFGYIKAYTPCARLDRFDVALPLMERAVTLDPNFPIAIKHVFQVRYNLGLLDDVTRELAERLVLLAPELVDSWNQLSMYYAECGRSGEAIAVLEAYLKEHPKSAQCHAALAHHRVAVDKGKSYEHAGTAMKLAPNDWYVCWIWLYINGRPQKDGNTSQGFRVARGIEERFEGDSFVLHVLSGFYRMRGCHAEALRLAQLAVKQSPESLMMHVHLGDTYSSEQRLKEAVESYRTAMSLATSEMPHVLARFAAALTMLADPESSSAWECAVAACRSGADMMRVADQFVSCGLTDRAITLINHGFMTDRFEGRARKLAEQMLSSLVDYSKLSDSLRSS